MTWTETAWAFALPVGVGLMVALLLRAVATDGGVATAIGAGVALMATFVLFALAFVDLSRMHAACRAAGKYCPVFPGDFHRYGGIGLLGFLAIALMYVVMLRIDERARRKAL